MLFHQTTALPQTLSASRGPTSKGRREDEGMEGEGTGGREGREWGKKGRGCPFFPEPTCQPPAQPMHLSDDAQMLSCNG